jgi:hypothetical protein
VSAQLNHRVSPLTSAEIKRIKARVAAGVRLIDIRKQFRISREKIWKIVGKQTGNIKERW